MIKSKKIALALSVFLALQPAVFAVDAALTKEIVTLELELTKMKTKSGEYADLSEDIKDAGKKAGKELQEAGKDIGNAFKEIFD